MHLKILPDPIDDRPRHWRPEDDLVDFHGRDTVVLVRRDTQRYRATIFAGFADHEKHRPWTGEVVDVVVALVRKKAQRQALPLIEPCVAVVAYRSPRVFHASCRGGTRRRVKIFRQTPAARSTTTDGIGPIIERSGDESRGGGGEDAVEACVIAIDVCVLISRRRASLTRRRRARRARRESFRSRTETSSRR